MAQLSDCWSNKIKSVWITQAPPYQLFSLQPVLPYLRKGAPLHVVIAEEEEVQQLPQCSLIGHLQVIFTGWGS